MRTTDTMESTTDLAVAAPAVRLRLAAVVLAGGSGTRLWPLSRKHFPKQLIDVIGGDTLLQTTARRLAGLVEGGGAMGEVAPIIVCGEAHRFMTAQQLAEAGVAARIVVEPAGRNTAPALTLAALLACAEGEDCILVAMPADHVIADNGAFQQAVLRAAGFAEQGAMVTLGVPPTRADTGFGYIRLGASLDDAARRIDAFVEKPAAELAAKYVASGEYWWNSGIFVVRAAVWLRAVSQLQPEMYMQCRAAYEAGEAGEAGGDTFRLNREAFGACQSDSIDYAVMEKLESLPDVPGRVVPLDAGWSDVGSWAAIWDIAPKDALGNAARGRVVFDGATACLAHSEGRLIACVGVHDVVVVETADAVLVVDKAHVQDVKNVVQRLRAEHGSEVVNHRKVHRPWGCYDAIDHGDRFQVKRIIVEPGASLSLQMHYHRAEHWVVVRGTARVTCGETVSILSENQSTYIPIGTLHRLENPGKTPLEIIEVQSGAYLGEDDIVRFEDNYGRK